MGGAAYWDNWAGVFGPSASDISGRRKADARQQRRSSHSRLHPRRLSSSDDVTDIRAEDFAASCGDRGLIAAPGPLLAPSLSPFFLWLGVLLSFRIGQRRDLEFHDQIQVLLDQCERVACRLSNLFR
jgi:hypothetical protein